MQKAVAIVTLTRHTRNGMFPVKGNSVERKGNDSHNDQKTCWSSQLMMFLYVYSSVQSAYNGFSEQLLCEAEPKDTKSGRVLPEMLQASGLVQKKGC